MQTLLTSLQMRKADEFTMANMPISSVDLMENAAKAFVKRVKKDISTKTSQIAVLCGQGNNGGDGLAIARLLTEDGYQNVAVYLIQFAAKESDDYKENLNRLAKTKIPIYAIDMAEVLHTLQVDLIIDAVLGSGLNKPLTGAYAALATIVNDLGVKKIIAVDVPSGFNSEGSINENYKGIKADLVISFQRPKLNFFFPESMMALTQFKVVDIGLNEAFIESQLSDWKLSTKDGVRKLIKPRLKFSHKGTYGHALLVAGNECTMGAAILSASACLHTGAGLTTVCLPPSGLTALNVALPEVMALPRASDLEPEALVKYTVIGIGPGLGTDEEELSLLTKIIKLKKPLVLDADALTLLARHPSLLNGLAGQSILTPHVKEFDRLFGLHKSWWDRVQTAKNEAQKRDLVIVLKNQYTFICLPNGMIRINPTGNQAMASGGVGDVLTGIITALLAQGYSSADAAILGVYLHGKAGDELAKDYFSLSAAQVAMQVPKTIKKLLKIK